MSYREPDRFPGQLIFGLVLAGLAGIGWLAVQGWHWLAAWWTH